jgi:hypothetical protein
MRTVITLKFPNAVWMLLRVEQILRLSENTGPKCKEVTGGYRKVYAEKLHNTYSLRNIIILSVDKMCCYVHARER